MRTKKILFGLGIGVVILLAFGIYKLSTFTLFDDEFKVTESIKIPDKNYSIKIYHIPSNASSQSYIQIRKIEDGVEEVLESYYNRQNKMSKNIKQNVQKKRKATSLKRLLFLISF